jgi:hypothetical protein
LLVNGQPTPPFSLKVDWDRITATPKNPDVAKEIREHSRMTYGKDAQEVESYINERAGFTEQVVIPEPSLGNLPF